MHLTVLSQIGVVLVLVGLGAFARRARLVDGASLGAMSRLVVDLSFPALVFTQLWKTVDPAALQAEWGVPVAALVMLPAGWWTARRLGAGRTAAFCIGLPNWIFLPLLIAEALYGGAGVRTVLLFNAGAQVAMWSVGVATLTGTSDLRALLRNPGLVATLAGIGVALAFPGAPVGGVGGTLFEAFALFGTLAVPLSLVVTGGQIGGLSGKDALRLDAALLAVLGGRLFAVPAVVWLVLVGLEATGLTMAPHTRLVLLVTAAMPVAISGAVLARRFGADADLAARAVLWSTVLSLATAPLLVRLVADHSRGTTSNVVGGR